MQKFSTKYLHTEFNDTLKRSYATIKLVSFQGGKGGSIYVNL
jgi:hypothetical protein